MQGNRKTLYWNDMDFIFSNVSGYGIELFEKEAKNHLGVMQIVTGGVEQNDSMATKKKKK